MPEGKVCTKCGEWKLLEGFPIDNRLKDGHRNICRVCDKIRVDAWRAENAEHLRQYAKDNPPDPVKKLEYNRRWNENGGREKKNESRRRWRKANPELNRERNAAYYEGNKERLIPLNKANKQRSKENDPERWALNNRRYGHERKARIKGATVERVDLKRVLDTHGMWCHICDQEILEPRGTRPGSLTFDHVIPLNRGGEHSEANLRPAHHFCNTGKGDRLDYASPFVLKRHGQP